MRKKYNIIFVPVAWPGPCLRRRWADDKLETENVWCWWENERFGLKFSMKLCMQERGWYILLIFVLVEGLGKEVER